MLPGGGEFRKSLNLFDATSLVAGSMIGSGIFIVSVDMAQSLGSPGWLIVTWILTGLMTVIAALSYGELASMMPKAGGQYIYLKEAYHPLFGFLYGWTLFLVIQTGTIAAVAMAFGKYMGELFPWFSEERVWFSAGFLKLNTVHIIAMGSIIVLTMVNMRGIKTGKVIQNLFTFTKVWVFLIFILLGLVLAARNQAPEVNSSVIWEAKGLRDGQYFDHTWLTLIAAICIASVGSLFTSDAWNNITFASGEVINPKKTIPRALFIGTLTVTALYVLANLVYLKYLPLRGIPGGSTVFERGIQFATNKRLGTAAVEILFGGGAAMMMAVFISVSTFGCNNGLILSGARVYYAMAQDKLFFGKAGTLNRRGVPAIALVVQAVWASLLCLTGTYSDLLDYVVFAVLIFYVLTITGIFVLRRKRPDAERPYTAFGYPFLPVLYILLATVIMVFLLIYKPVYTWPGLLIVLTGVPVYFLWRKWGR